MDPKIERLKQRFYQVFSDSGRHTTVTKAPGRVSLMGDHTDLHEGLVLSVNFPQEITVIAQPRADGMLGMYNLEVEERIQVPVHNLRYVPGDGWANYPKGIIWSLENAGQKLEGLNILIEGKLPQGVGLASSSALGAAVALAAASLDGFQMDSKGMAKVLQRAENQFVHAHSGVSDAMSILAARTGNALYTDCRTLDAEQVSLAFEGAMLVVLDSGIARSLKTGDHAKRLEECKEAFKLLKTKNEAYQSLRDIKVLAFERHKKVLSPILAARAEHVIYEMDRAAKAKDAMSAGDAVAFGELMNKSHRSLSRLYQCSTEELDTLVGIASAEPSCLGARLSGGGFGGIAIALVKEEGLDEFMDKVKRHYWQRVGGKMKSWVLDIVEPAREIED